jgi:clan AA aspartic protease
MGSVYTEIVLKNVGDRIRVQAGLITEQEVHEISVRACVDTGAWTLVINEEIRKKLGLAITGTNHSTLADGTREIYEVTEAVEVNWKNRNTVCQALVLPDAKDVLLGAIPLEGMDLTINPRKQEVVGIHGDEAVYMLW